MLLCLPLLATPLDILEAQSRYVEKDLLMSVSLQSHKTLELEREIAEYQRGGKVTFI